MKPFDPSADVENAGAILDAGEWPNFHDAIVYSLNLWRGDMRPDQNIWIGPTIEASFLLDALETPYVVDLRFHDCDCIHMSRFDNINEIFMLTFSFEARGFLTDGVTPLTPYVCVRFDGFSGQQPWFTFKCFRVEAVGRRPASPPPCR